MVHKSAEHDILTSAQSAAQVQTPYKSLSQLSPSEQTQELTELGSSNALFLIDNCPQSSLPPATLGMFDNPSYNGTAWTRDIEESISPAVDRNVIVIFSEHREVLVQFFLRNQRRLLQRYAWDDEWWRLGQRPQPIDGGLTMVHDDLAPTTKFMIDGRRVDPWSHNQLDAIARILSVSAAAIRLDMPLLAPAPDDIKPAGEILLKIASYLAAQTGSNIATHGPWENDHCLTPGSTKAEINQALIDTFKIHQKLQQDSQQRGYPIHITTQELSEAIYAGLREQNKEFPYDWTAPYGHPDPADLAQLKTVVDVNLPSPHREMIIKQTQPLEGELGYIRFKGDTWGKQCDQAPWTLGFLYRACIDGELAIKQYNFGNPDQTQYHLNHGLLMLDRIRQMIHEYHYLPELHQQDPNDGFKFKPNRNDLSWGRAMVTRASAAMITALQMTAKTV